MPLSLISIALYQSLAISSSKSTPRTLLPFLMYLSISLQPQVLQAPTTVLLSTSNTTTATTPTTAAATTGTATTAAAATTPTTAATATTN